MKTQCPYCKSLYQFEKQDLGKTFECSLCKNVIVLEENADNSQESATSPDSIIASCSPLRAELSEFPRTKKLNYSQISLILSIVALFFSITSLICSINSCDSSTSKTGQSRSKTSASGIPQKYMKAHEIFGITKADVDFLEKQTSVEALHATMPSSPEKVMVIATLGDYYNYGYRDTKSTFYSIRCSCLTRSNYALGGERFTDFGTGYIARDSKDGQLLFEKLKDGYSHIAIISICYDYRSKDQGDIFKISQVHEVR